MAAKAVYRGLRNHKGTVYIKIKFHFFSSYLMFKGSRIPFLTYLMSFKVIFKVKCIKRTKKCHFFHIQNGNIVIAEAWQLLNICLFNNLSCFKGRGSTFRHSTSVLDHIQGRMVKQWRKWDLFVKLSYFTTCMWDG